MKILVDAMGGDNAPLCVLQGASQAAAEFGDGMELVLLGEEAAIKTTPSRLCATKRIPACSRA